MYVKSITAGMLFFAFSAYAFAFPPPTQKGPPKNEIVVAAPADFDGDGKTDLAELTATGVLRIDFANNGFGGWDVVLNKSGDQNSKVFAADFDGDKRIDIGLRAPNGFWKIDYAKNGFGKWDLDRAITMNAKNAIREFLGKSIAVFDNPDSVELFQIKLASGDKGKTILGHAITKVGPKLTLDQLGVLQSMVFNVNNYHLETLPRTKQYPNFAIRITKGKQSVVILYSTYTKLLSITRDGDEYLADFSPGAPELTQLLNSLSPQADNPAKEN